jgi:rRNA-processing protein FCF1
LRRNDVDRAIEEFAGENKDVIIATLDKELKDKIQNSKMVIKNLKTLEII